MADWVGQLNCKSYCGIKKIEKKQCCGGKILLKPVVKCSTHNFAYSDTNCREQLCGQYERKKDED